METSEIKDETVKSLTDPPPIMAPDADSRRCSGCGLTVPPELDKCPNDGIVIDKPPQDLLPNNYEFIDLIGKGGMSVIYKARHRLMENIVAIKLLQEKLTEDRSAFLRFRQEAQASSRLDHPNIIKVTDFGVLQHGAAYLVMDYLEGGSLSDLIKREGKLPIDRALPLFMQIAEGLSHAHNKGVLHRDLKPSNVLVVQQEGRERIKILDFGIAKVLAPEGAEASKLTSTGEVFGSPLYMSPEQCQGLDVDARSDIYSMGCLMYEAVSGVPPFVGSNPLETLFKQMNDTPVPIMEHEVRNPVAQQLWNVLRRALEKDPAHRYQSFDALLDDLHKVERGQKVTVRHRMPLWLIAGSAAVIIPLCIFFFVENYHAAIPDRVFQSAKAGGMIVWQEGRATDADCALMARYPVRKIELRTNKKITTKGMSEFLKMPDIEEFYIDETGVDDQFMKNLAQAPCRNTLKVLAIGRTKITSNGFRYLSALPNLQELFLLDMHLKDKDVAAIPAMPNVSKLKLDWNPEIDDGAISYVMERFPALHTLSLRKTSCTNQTVEILGAAFLWRQGGILVQAWGSKIDLATAPRFHRVRVKDQYVQPWWEDPKRVGAVGVEEK